MDVFACGLLEIEYVIAPDDGRVSSTMDHFNSIERVMVTQAPIQSASTLYPYIGDLFAWLAMAGFAAVIVAAIYQGRKNRG